MDADVYVGDSVSYTTYCSWSKLGEQLYISHPEGLGVGIVVEIIVVGSCFTPSAAQLVPLELDWGNSSFFNSLLEAADDGD